MLISVPIPSPTPPILRSSIVQTFLDFTCLVLTPDVIVSVDEYYLEICKAYSDIVAMLLKIVIDLLLYGDSSIH